MAAAQTNEWLLVARKATRLASDGTRETRWLSEWRELDAYVLLGDPGSGKSTAFQMECSATAGQFVRAVDVAVAAGDQPGDVFIDGLDEIRAGSNDQRAPFNEIRKWLVSLGRRRFRISCREADWRGASDLDGLRAVAPGGEVFELHLESLTEDDIRLLVENRLGEAASQRFFETIEQVGVYDLLRNPLLLDLMVHAGTAGVLPRNRAGLYLAACSQLVTEHNTEHLPGPFSKTGLKEDLLRDAGLLCALLLLSGHRGIAREGADGLRLQDIPKDLLPELQRALQSKLFTADSGLLAPRHRTIAEYLAGRALASRLEAGLPLGRVMALMQGFDGRPVEPLRGVWAWLAVHHLPGRQRLIDRDPLGFVLNGDAATLAVPERLLLLDALRAEAERDPWFFHGVWVQQPFAALAVPEMAHALQTLLRDARRDRAHLSVISLVLSALQAGIALPILVPDLENWVLDAKAPELLRAQAFLAWKHCSGFDTALARQWLDGIRAGQISDENDRLSGLLLCSLYPSHLSASEVIDYWHEPKNERDIGDYWMFWSQLLWKRTQSGHVALIEAWLRRFPIFHESANDHHLTPAVRGRLLHEALVHAGDRVSDQTLFVWLGILIDDQGSFRRQHARENPPGDWLADRPDRMKAVYAIALALIAPNKDGHWPFWQADERLLDAKRPRDWYRWLLGLTGTEGTVERTRHCFDLAAQAALYGRPNFDITMEEVESWVEKNVVVWPEARQWLQDAWSVPVNHWSADQHRSETRYRKKIEAAANIRRQEIAPLLPRLLDGSAPPSLLHHVAVAYERGYSDLRGDTELTRTQDFLGTDELTTRAVVAALPKVLDREDLPCPTEELDRQQNKRMHFLRTPALVAARLLTETNSEAALQWPRPLAERLFAYYLCDGTGNRPAWFDLLARERVDWVAPILLRYARSKLKEKASEHLHIVGLSALKQDASYAELARRVLPDLLAAVSGKASKAHRRVLVTDLLPALPLLPPEQAEAIVRARLSRKLDPAQYIAWLVADLPFRAAAAEELETFVGSNEQRAVWLGYSLRHMSVLRSLPKEIQPAAIRHLLGVLAPITTIDAYRSGFVTEADERRDAVRSLFGALSNSPSVKAREALIELAESPSMQRWSEEIQYRLRAQVATAREAGFRTATPTQVAAALGNKAPANSADLRALVVEQLMEIQADLHGKDTFALRQFWRGASGKDRRPKIENECRDLLLERLRPRLNQLSVSVQREASAAQDKRADLRADVLRDGLELHLPIEVKKEDSDDLWTAWYQQLLRLYAIDPGAQGLGLYLVFWFGHKPRSTPEGQKPISATELRSLLEARIPTEDRHRLLVHVIDLSWPKDN